MVSVSQVTTADLIIGAADLHTMVGCHCGQVARVQQPEWEPAHGAGAAHRPNLHVRPPCHGLMVTLPEVGLVFGTVMV